MTVRVQACRLRLDLLFVLKTKPVGDPPDHVAPLAQSSADQQPLAVEAVHPVTTGNDRRAAMHHRPDGPRGTDCRAEPVGPIALPPQTRCAAFTAGEVPG